MPPSVKETIKFLLDACAAFSFALALLSAKNASWRDRRRIHHSLAGFSYTLYVAHFPILIFLGAVAHDRFGIELASVPRLPNVLTAAAFIVIAGVLAWAFAQVTERHTAKVRDALVQLMPRVRSLGRMGRPGTPA
jgi:peptidoglycan/LPS O-acetylase OafA/YrhL